MYGILHWTKKDTQVFNYNIRQNQQNKSSCEIVNLHYTRLERIHTYIFFKYKFN